MYIGTIRHHRDKQPFEPFTIHMASGRSYPVGHPEAISISLTERTVGVMAPDEGIDTLDVLLITEVTPLRREPSAQ